MKVIIVKKRNLFSVLACLICIIILCFCLFSFKVSAVFLQAKEKRLPIYRVLTDEKVVALSFDATYGTEYTEKIIEILKKYNFDATFFLVGFWMDKNPEITKMIAENGFEIGTHSNVHAHMSKLSYEQSLNDLKLSVDKIKKYTGRDTTIFRAPFGEYNNTLLNAAEALNLKTIQWDVDSLDWKNISTAEIIQRVTSKVKEGSIVLFHNGAEHVLEYLPPILENLTQRGYKGVCIGSIIYQDDYYINNAGEQIKNKN